MQSRRIICCEHQEHQPLTIKDLPYDELSLYSFIKKRDKVEEKTVLKKFGRHNPSELIENLLLKRLIYVEESVHEKE